MDDEIRKILNMDVKYPGIFIKVELTAIAEYLKQLDSGIDRICDNYITTELEKYEGAEYHEYQHVYDIAETEIPRLIRYPFSISTYSLFESSVIALLQYGKEKEDKKLSYRDINGRSQISRFNKYMQHILGYDFTFSSEQVQQLTLIYKIRNIMAHANGSLVDIEESEYKKLREMLCSVPGVSFGSWSLDVTSEYLKYSLCVVDGALRSLMTYMEDRYDFSTGT